MMPIGLTGVGLDDLILFVGVLLGGGFVFWRVSKQNYSIDFFISLIPYLILWGAVGSRMFHVLAPRISMVSRGMTTQYYATHLLDVLFFAKGGFEHSGAFFAGVLVLWWMARQQKKDFFLWADLFVPGILLSHAIGKWANWVNQILYGVPTNLPWAIDIDAGYRLPGFEEIVQYHPLFFYESMSLLGLLVFLLWIEHKKNAWLVRGDLFLMYLFGYGVMRWGFEFILLDISKIGTVNLNQLVAIVFIIFGSGGLFIRHSS